MFNSNSIPRLTRMKIKNTNRSNENLLNFYRIVMNQSLFDLKRLVNEMTFIDNNIEEPESYRKDFLTISTLLNTYLGVCDTVDKMKEDV